MEDVSILRGLKGKYEVHHGVRIQDSAILAAARLLMVISQPVFTRQGIDLIDEAASSQKWRSSVQPRLTSINEKLPN